MRLYKEGKLDVQQSGNPKLFSGRKGHLPNANCSLVSLDFAQVSFGILHHPQLPHIGVVPPLG